MLFRLQRNLKHLVLAAALLATAAARADAPEKDAEPERPIAVITHLDNPVTTITRSELARIFMKLQTVWDDDSRAVPIDQRGDSDIRREFSRLILKKSVYEMKRYWMQETMTGNAKPPVSLESAATVKKYVQKIAGAVGYIYADEVDDTVRVLEVSDVAELASPPKTGEREPGSEKASGDKAQNTNKNTAAGNGP